jgi:hypothetical protein
MNEQLALKTISEILEWDQEARDEFAWLRLVCRYKFDAYEGYEPGLRFYASLIGWLKQFPSLKDRRTAYGFLKSHLIFFSRIELVHLVHRFWPTVQQTIIKSVATDLEILPYQLWENPGARKEFDIQLRQSLFIGLSDGAKMDIFRRDNEGRISNEQTVVAHEISGPKWDSMQEELQKCIDRKGWSAEPIFRHIFLIDDFTASGTSLIRNVGGEWGGKIPKFISQCKDVPSDKLKNPCQLHVHHYLASEYSRSAIELLVQQLQDAHPSYKIDLSFGHIIENALNVSKDKCPEFNELLINHYDKSVETDISKCVQFGYKEGRLAVVLEHNTPNNTVALIWAETKESDMGSASTPMSPLFRRRTRHL